MTTVHLLHAGYTGDRVGFVASRLVRDGDALIVADPGMVASRSLILDPLPTLGVAPGGRDPRLPQPPPPRPHDEHRAVPERRGRRLLGALPGRPVARPRRRRLPPSPEHAALADPRPHRGGRHAHRRGRRRRLRDDPPVVARRPDARDRPVLRPTRRALEAGRERVLAAADIVIPGHGGAVPRPR